MTMTIKAKQKILPKRTLPMVWF